MEWPSKVSMPGMVKLTGAFPSRAGGKDDQRNSPASSRRSSLLSSMAWSARYDDRDDLGGPEFGRAGGCFCRVSLPIAVHDVLEVIVPFEVAEVHIIAG